MNTSDNTHGSVRSAYPLVDATLTRRAFIGGATATALVLGSSPVSATGRSSDRVDVSGLSAGHASDWVRTLYGVVMNEAMTPPAAARFYYYTSLTMYETVRPAMPGFRSLAGQVPDLDRVHRPTGPFDAPLAMSAAVSTVALALVPMATADSIARIDEHHRSVVADRSPGLRRRIVERSLEHGARVGAQLVAWMADDGYASTSMPYDPPVGPDKWRSTPPNFGTAIEPYWHLVRPALLTSADEVVPRPHVPFSIERGSAFHDQAMATYDQSAINTADQIAIARFWTDNPRLSGLPSGHWFLLLAQVVDTPLALGLDRALEAFVRLGVALHDAFLNCWTWKYRLNLIRPVTYIRDHVDPAWNTVVNTPQFPEYTSGHSVSSGAAEVVLTELLGSFPFVDSTGVSRGLAERQFASFTHAADEAAISRLYGGIHYPMGIDNGLAQGREIGRLVNARLRTRSHRWHWDWDWD
jgi:hypothetical protein